MKIKIFLLPLIISGNCYCSSITEIDRRDYSKIFSVKIYDQTNVTIPQQYNVENYSTDENTKNILRQNLRSKKEEHIEIKCGEWLTNLIVNKQRSLEEIQTELKNVYQSQKELAQKNSWIKTAIDSVPLAAGFFGPIGVMGGSILSNLTSKVTSQVDAHLKEGKSQENAQKAIQVSLKKTEYSNLKQDIDNARNLKDFLLRGIDNENPALRDLEEQYIYKKCFYPKELQDKIEEAFIEARTSIVSNLEKPENFISKALTIPLLRKDLSRIWPTDIELLEAFDRDSIFSICDNAVKENLKRLVYEIFLLSKNDRSDSNFERINFYFCGDPGIGKSYSARHIAEFLRLPFFELPIRTDQDLSQQSMEGSPRVWQNSQIGFLMETFLAKDQAGNSYKNPLLIINDFDRVFLNGSGTGVNFLLHFLDRNVRQFFNNYFASNFDITGLTVIITGNHAIPDETRYDALRERLQILSFSGINSNGARNILRNFATSLSSSIGLDMVTAVQQKISELSQKPTSIRRMKEDLRKFMVSEKLATLQPGNNNQLHNAAEIDNNNQTAEKGYYCNIL